jgi:hypothetical protein
MTIIHDSHESNCVSDEYDKSGKNWILFMEDILYNKLCLMEL